MGGPSCVLVHSSSSSSGREKKFPLLYFILKRFHFIKKKTEPAAERVRVSLNMIHYDAKDFFSLLFHTDGYGGSYWDRGRRMQSVAVGLDGTIHSCTHWPTLSFLTLGIHVVLEEFIYRRYDGEPAFVYRNRPDHLVEVEGRLCVMAFGWVWI